MRINFIMHAMEAARYYKNFYKGEIIMTGDQILYGIVMLVMLFVLIIQSYRFDELESENKELRDIRDSQQLMIKKHVSGFIENFSEKK